MSREELLDQIAELVMAYEESTDNKEVVGTVVLFENGMTNNHMFKWDVFSFTGEEMRLVPNVYDVDYKRTNELEQQ